MGIRANLAALMSHRNISQYALAKAAGVPQPTIQRILTGESADPKTGTVAKLARYFGVSVEELRGTQGGLTLKDGPALTEEALDLARLWSGLPEARRRAIKENIFLIAMTIKKMPWLDLGRPSTESYEEFERRVLKALDDRRSGNAPPRSKK